MVAACSASLLAFSTPSFSTSTWRGTRRCVCQSTSHALHPSCAALVPLAAQLSRCPPSASAQGPQEVPDLESEALAGNADMDEASWRAGGRAPIAGLRRVLAQSLADSPGEVVGEGGFGRVMRMAGAPDTVAKVIYLTGDSREDRQCQAQSFIEVSEGWPAGTWLRTALGCAWGGGCSPYAPNLRRALQVTGNPTLEL